ncbi:ISAzo13 family transposase [Nonomuraea sp. WAC 01424]|uniref:ISAzo13 family transposase n=1 Tax=Nonomuraea sp. WAC 01424 TaxID=2203200 RepID=UPI0021AD632B|nr:ISAzo13 family transposase [Nonomuraea sp. WAC 01424]
MAVSVETVGMLEAKLEAILPHLDERQRRLLLGAEARALGHGGIRAVARAAGVREATVSLGVTELEAGDEPLGRVRRPGGGRKRLTDLDPGLRPALLALVESDERGDPMSPLRWTTKSTRKLAAELTRQGHKVSADTVAGILRAEGFSLQGNAKTIEGKQHPDRDGQFRYINEQVKRFQEAEDPVVSVDTKKKELVGPFANGGTEWRPQGEPVQVRTHDFPDSELGKAIPYGVYDLAADTGWVSVGTDHDTAAFAVETIRRWWKNLGQGDYPLARRLLITADCGGSNGNRTRAWKSELAALAVETGLEITVCHFPPGTSKWNKIEHRLFSHITMNWRGRPLTSHEVIVNAIAATITATGMTVLAELDASGYETGVTVSDQQMKALPLTRHDWHGDWNYTLHPIAADQLVSPDDQTGQHEHPDRTWLQHAALTGLDQTHWDELIAKLDVARHAQREAALHHRRGGIRQAAPGTGRKAVLDLTDRAALTIVYQRFSVPQRTLAKLFGITQQSAHNIIRLTRPLLTVIGYTPQPTGLRLATPTEFIQHATDIGALTPDQINPACY